MNTLDACLHLISPIYQAIRESSGRSTVLLEQWIGYDVTRGPLSADDRRNQQSYYQQLFSGDCQKKVAALLVRAMQALHGLEYEQSSDVLATLNLLQMIIANALWRFDVKVSPFLEDFAREFDRLDDSEVSLLLHHRAQSDEWKLEKT